MEKELIKYCLSEMANIEHIVEMLDSFGRKPAKKTIKKNEAIKLALECPGITLDYITQFFREKRTRTNIDIHLDNLKSGKLAGHDWHKAMPSFLHRSLQDRVRECSAGMYSFDELLNIGADIMKQEYFIVAQHDILEASIIEHFEDTIPPIKAKCITDFVFRGIPVDLKVSDYKGEWANRIKNNEPLTDDEKKSLIAENYQGADSERIRKQADGSINNWGFNRMYVFIKDQDEWFSNPEGIVNRVLAALDNTRDPYKIDIDDFTIEAFCIEA